MRVHSERVACVWAGGERTSNDDQVTCLVCLYHLGRYVPLVRLSEHRRREKSRAYATDDVEAIWFWRDENRLAWGAADVISNR